MTYTASVLIFVAVPILFGLLHLAAGTAPSCARSRGVRVRSQGLPCGGGLIRRPREILSSGEVANPARAAASPVLSAATKRLHVHEASRVVAADPLVQSEPGVSP